MGRSTPGSGFTPPREVVVVFLKNPALFCEHPSHTLKAVWLRFNLSIHNDFPHSLSGGWGFRKQTTPHYNMKIKAPNLTPQQRAQVLGDKPTSAAALADIDLRAFLKIARKMYGREYPPVPALVVEIAKCSYCQKPSTIIGLSRALDLLEGDLQTLSHQIKPVIEATRVLLARLQKNAPVVRKGS
jgi:hypothetical protein